MLNNVRWLHHARRSGRAVGFHTYASIQSLPRESNSSQDLTKVSLHLGAKEAFVSKGLRKEKPRIGQRGARPPRIFPMTPEGVAGKQGIEP
jgi:hypothetical protein